MSNHLCKNCHEPMTEAAVIRRGVFCTPKCVHQWSKLSLEDARAMHYAWVREEAKANQ
jgi:hypothetical protein